MTRRISAGDAFMAAVLGGVWLYHEHHARRSAERLAAGVFETLLFAVDANDAETGAHMRRVARYALVLAKGANLAAHEQRSVERVALFHDIGKIHGALNDIVRDDGALTPDEREAILTHPARGAEVLSPLAAFYPDLPRGVLTHHERWDGTGYPHGLRRKAIPLVARVVAIADTFDVVTHGRRYSTKRTLAEARKEMTEGRGTQFDPVLTDIFLSDRIFPEIEQQMRAARRLERSTRDDRRADSEESAAPDVTFRWRSEAPGRPRRGLGLRTRRG